MKISLVDRSVVDKRGVGHRVAEDIRQLGISSVEEPPEGFVDWGVVMFDGFEYYMSSYNPPEASDDEADQTADS